MAHPNTEILRRQDQAMLDGDIDRMMSFFTEDVVVHIGGTSPMAGVYKGHDQFRELFGRFMEHAGDYRFENHAYLADDEHGVTLQRSTATRSGKTLGLEEVMTFHFREGAISEMWYLPTDQSAFDAWYS